MLSRPFHLTVTLGVLLLGTTACASKNYVAESLEEHAAAVDRRIGVVERSVEDTTERTRATAAHLGEVDTTASTALDTATDAAEAARQADETATSAMRRAGALEAANRQLLFEVVLSEDPTAGGTHEGFELREAELNGIEVWTVGRQIPERGADALDRAADARDFVGGEIVGDHDVPGSQRGHEDLFDIGKETRPVDGAVEDPGRGQARHPQRGEQRTGLPPGARRVVVDAGPAEGPTIPPQEIVRNAGFVEKDQACRIPGRRGGVPHDPRGRDVRSIVFGGPDRFF